MTWGNTQEPALRATGRAGLRRVDKPDRVRCLGAVGVEDLRREVARLSERVWVQEDRAKENNFRCFHHTRHIISASSPATAIRAASTRSPSGRSGGGCCFR